MAMDNSCDNHNSESIKLSRLPVEVDVEVFQLQREQQIGLVKLVKDLIELKPKNMDEILTNAYNGVYTEYESQLTMPIHALVGDLTMGKCHKMIEKARRGEYIHEYIYRKGEKPGTNKVSKEKENSIQTGFFR